MAIKRILENKVHLLEVSNHLGWVSIPILVESPLSCNVYLISFSLVKKKTKEHKQTSAASEQNMYGRALHS